MTKEAATTMTATMGTTTTATTDATDAMVREIVRREVAKRFAKLSDEAVSALEEEVRRATTAFEAAKAAYENAKTALREAQDRLDEAKNVEDRINKEVDRILAAMRGEKPVRTNGNGKRGSRVENFRPVYYLDGKKYDGQQRTFSDVVWYLFASKDRSMNVSRVRAMIKDQTGIEVFSPDHAEKGTLTAIIMGKEFRIDIQKDEEAQ